MKSKARRNGNGVTKAKNCNVIDLTKAPYRQFGHGIVRGNPRKCLVCLKSIRKDDDWVKDTSEEDPKYGRYSVIIHSGCATRNR